MAERYHVDALLIEDAASGKELISSLRRTANRYAKSPLPQGATVHKEVRAWGQTAFIERGDMLLPTAAPWLTEFHHELLSFPKGRNDDCVDALVHLLAWVDSRVTDLPINASPELIDGRVYYGSNSFDDPDFDPWI